MNFTLLFLPSIYRTLPNIFFKKGINTPHQQMNTLIGLLPNKPCVLIILFIDRFCKIFQPRSILSTPYIMVVFNFLRDPYFRIIVSILNATASPVIRIRSRIIE